jgi:hypothetical protein
MADSTDSNDRWIWQYEIIGSSSGGEITAAEGPTARPPTPPLFENAIKVTPA